MQKTWNGPWLLSDPVYGDDNDQQRWIRVYKPDPSENWHLENRVYFGPLVPKEEGAITH